MARYPIPRVDQFFAPRPREREPFSLTEARIRARQQEREDLRRRQERQDARSEARFKAWQEDRAKAARGEEQDLHLLRLQNDLYDWKSRQRLDGRISKTDPESVHKLSEEALEHFGPETEGLDERHIEEWEAHVDSVFSGDFDAAFKARQAAAKASMAAEIGRSDFQLTQELNEIARRATSMDPDTRTAGLDQLLDHDKRVERLVKLVPVQDQDAVRARFAKQRGTELLTNWVLAMAGENRLEEAEVAVARGRDWIDEKGGPRWSSGLTREDTRKALDTARTQIRNVMESVDDMDARQERAAARRVKDYTEEVLDAVAAGGDMETELAKKRLTPMQKERVRNQWATETQPQRTLRAARAKAEREQLTAEAKRAEKARIEGRNELWLMRDRKGMPIETLLDVEEISEVEQVAILSVLRNAREERGKRDTMKDEELLRRYMDLEAGGTDALQLAKWEVKDTSFHDKLEARLNERDRQEGMTAAGDVSKNSANVVQALTLTVDGLTSSTDVRREKTRLRGMRLRGEIDETGLRLGLAELDGRLDALEEIQDARQLIFDRRFRSWQILAGIDTSPVSILKDEDVARLAHLQRVKGTLERWFFEMGGTEQAADVVDDMARIMLIHPWEQPTETREGVDVLPGERLRVPGLTDSSVKAYGSVLEAVRAGNLKSDVTDQDLFRIFPSFGRVDGELPILFKDGMVDPGESATALKQQGWTHDGIRELVKTEIRPRIAFAEALRKAIGLRESMTALQAELRE